MRLLLIALGYLPYTFSENLCNGKLAYAMYKKVGMWMCYQRWMKVLPIRLNGQNLGCHLKE